MIKILDYDFKILSVANERCLPEWSWNSERNGWIGFLLWYVYANNVKIVIRGKEYNLSAGDIYIFDLSKNHYCTHDPQKPLAVYSIHLQCTQPEDFAARLRSGVIPVTQHLKEFEINLRILEHLMEIADDPIAQEIWLQPVLFQFLTQCRKTNEKHSAIKMLCEHINSNLGKGYSLEYLCRMTGYSKSHFIRLFKEVTGSTPKNYIISAKINKAKSLLLFSDFNVTQIADSLGYHDVNHFSGQFLLKVGCSPSAYVKNLQAANEIQI